VDVTLVARYLPLVSLTDLDVIEASVVDESTHADNSRWPAVERAFRAVAAMLRQHMDSQDFVDDVLGEHRDEFEDIVGGILSEWEEVADSVSGRYQTLVLDNLSTVLDDLAGVRGLVSEMEAAVEAMKRRRDVP
jgi:hypothetical protein